VGAVDHRQPERCIRQIRALEAVGVDLLLLNMNFGNMTHREAMRSLRLFVQEVLPAFRSPVRGPSLDSG
jgi:hypothetical protein